MIESLSDRSERLPGRGRSGSKHCTDGNSMRKERVPMRIFREQEELGDGRNAGDTLTTPSHNSPSGGCLI
jgi:hypothetical protein